jgi:hypothetical protein
MTTDCIPRCKGATDEPLKAVLMSNPVPTEATVAVTAIQTEGSIETNGTCNDFAAFLLACSPWRS